MATIHISQAEAARDLNALVARLDRDTTFIIDGETKRVAVTLLEPPTKLTLSERIALLPKDARGVIDDDFPADVEAAVASHREPIDSSLWDE